MEPTSTYSSVMSKPKYGSQRAVGCMERDTIMVIFNGFNSKRRVILPDCKSRLPLKIEFRRKKLISSENSSNPYSGISKM